MDFGHDEGTIGYISCRYLVIIYHFIIINISKLLKQKLEHVSNSIYLLLKFPFYRKWFGNFIFQLVFFINNSALLFFELCLIWNKYINCMELFLNQFEVFPIFSERTKHAFPLMLTEKSEIMTNLQSFVIQSSFSVTSLYWIEIYFDCIIISMSTYIFQEMQDYARNMKLP